MKTEINRAFIALGANLQTPLHHIDTAVEEINQQTAIRCLAMSAVYQSRPHGPQDQPDYLNAVICVETRLLAKQLLRVMQRIEQAHGRVRDRHWGARVLDLDLILYGNHIINTAELIIPHPFAHQREFVIKPLHDLDPELVIPEKGCVADYLTQLPLDNLKKVREKRDY